MAHSKPRRAALFAVGLAFIIGMGAAIGDIAPPARAEQTQRASAGLAPDAPGERVGARMRVIDGDTLEDMREDITYRVVNIDTPETGSRARCAAERALGDRATATARTLVEGARQLELRPTGRQDRYGRTIAFVLIDGRDLGETLIAEGLARPWRGRRQPWCDANGDLLP